MRLGEIGRIESGGVSRMALSEDDLHAQELVSLWMSEAGLTVRRDDYGNLIGRNDGNHPDAPAIALGSHVDSVRNGGNFDGTIGVIGAIEVAQYLHQGQLDVPIEVIAFCDEEGARFHGGLFGSRGMAGQTDEQDLQVEDDDGISRFQALQKVGLKPANREASVRAAGEFLAYLEMHIEQGPVLESLGESVGIVTGISGIKWLRIRLTGTAGHAGTVPMHLRRDPMPCAAEIIREIERVALSSDGNVVATIGKINASPGSSNVIPAELEFTVDMRSPYKEHLQRTADQVFADIQEICTKRSIEYCVDAGLDLSPVPCSADIVRAMEQVGEQSQHPLPKLASGAGHDAMAMGQLCNMGMLFVRCKDGISHRPEEWADIDDIVKGTTVLLQTVLVLLGY